MSLEETLILTVIFPGKTLEFFVLPSTFFAFSHLPRKLQYFLLFIRFLHVIVLLTIIITFYAFNNFPFPAIFSFFRVFPLYGFDFRNVNEMKISRKINFSMQIFFLQLFFFLFPFVSRSSIYNDAICRVDLNILLIWLLFETLQREKLKVHSSFIILTSHSESIYGRINHYR